MTVVCLTSPACTARARRARVARTRRVPRPFLRTISQSPIAALGYGNTRTEHLDERAEGRILRQSVLGDQARPGRTVIVNRGGTQKNPSKSYRCDGH